MYQVKNSTQDKKTYLSASHDGYKRLPGKPVHSRQWIFSESLIEIIDRISGKGYHTIDIVLPLHPDVIIIENKNNNIIFFTSYQANSVDELTKSWPSRLFNKSSTIS